jgi:hypothetical protein
MVVLEFGASHGGVDVLCGIPSSMLGLGAKELDGGVWL